MTLRLGLVVPVYNHGPNFIKTCERLQAYDLPMFVVDDGSDATTQAILQDLAATTPTMRLHRLPENQGKGGAVIAGMKLAAAAGMTHVLQIDADGQHDTHDVPKFVALAHAHPEAVICGRPIYDASVPKGRLYGRYLTHFWVWVETLSFDIADSMCGFRLYPLAPCLALIESRSLLQRMAFDTEIMVRLYWRGVAVINVPTRVIYPADGVSHFQMLADNWRISTMHTRLFFGMLPRAPLLIWRQWVRRWRRPA